MNKIQIASLALLAIAPLCAQVTNYAVSPPKYASAEGGYYAYYLGAHQGPSTLYQLADGELRGKVMSVKEIALRADGTYSYSTYYGGGRTYQKVQIDMCDTDVATMSNTFSMNHKSTPTRVFSSSMTWPTLNGYQTPKPQPWGGTTGAYKFPFNKGSWLTLGQKDILTEWRFDGGTLANGLAWTTSSYRYYRFDGWQALSPTSSTSGSYSSMPPTRLNNNSGGVTGRCNDSAHTYTTGSYLYAYAYLYGKYYTSSRWRNKLRIYSYSYYTSFDAPVIHALGILPDTKGVDIGTGCNKLHMHPASIAVMMTGRTLPKQYNSSGYSGYMELLVPFNPAWSSVDVAMQGAWADSKTGKLNLTSAQRVTLPNGDPEPLHSQVRTYNGTNRYGPYSTNTYNPIRRYGF